VERGLPAAAGLTLAGEAIGPSQSPQGWRRHLLEVNGEVVGGRLQLAWTFSPGRHHRSTVERLARGLVEALAELIEHCRSAEAGGYTPSDFPLARLDQEGIDRLLGHGGG
jgi:non-ribosomal peptide synthase protein (TIGR01720 family)